MLNKVILIGNLGKDPETHTFENGMKKVSFSLATTERWKDKATGERKEKTEWHNIVVVRDGLTQIAQNYLTKGKQIYLEGRIQTRSWDDQNGQKRYMTEISAENIVMLGGREGGGNDNGGNHSNSNSGYENQTSPRKTQAAPPEPMNNSDFDDDGGDLPF